METTFLACECSASQLSQWNKAETYQGTHHALLAISKLQETLACPSGDWAGSSQIGAVSIVETLAYQAGECETMGELSLRHRRSQVSACDLFACSGFETS